MIATHDITYDLDEDCVCEPLATYLGYWDRSHWILWVDQVYRMTDDGPRWEGSYAWFSVAAADRFLRGDTDKSA